MKRHDYQSKSLALAALALVCALTGCRTRLLENIAPTIVQASCRQVEQTSKLDLLFLVDNSTSMDSMQDELRHRFPEFLQVFRELAARGRFIDLHIGVVTSDYGAGKSGSGNCEPSPGGQRGMLQAIGQLAAADCKPPVGANYAQYVFNATNDGMNNLPPGQSLEQTFACMASVGARGCGFEHQLESVYAALHGDVPENAGFLRDDAMLVVLFLTNEDDCSAPPDSDLFDPLLTFKYGYLGGAGYRCARFGVVCGSPPASLPYGSSNGPLTQCAPAPNRGGTGPGKLYDISRYVDLFTQPSAQGGVAFDPNDVMLVAIDAPPEPFSVMLADPGTGNDGKPYTMCGALDENGNPGCVPVVQHSCRNDAVPVFFGDPAVRINTVVKAAAHGYVASICDSSYTSALQDVGKLIGSQLGDCCMPERLPTDPRTPDDPKSITATCVVTQVTRNIDGTTTTVTLPACDEGGRPPCYRVGPIAQCATISPQGVGVTVDRTGTTLPPHTTISATCQGFQR